MKVSKPLLLLGLLPICSEALGYSAPTKPYSNSRDNFGTVPVNLNLNRYTIVQGQSDSTMKVKAKVYPKWYVGANIFYNWAKFESRHLTNGIYDPSDPYSKDEFSIFQLGGAISLGQKFNKNWRLEGEAGWFGKYSEQEDGVEFSINTKYLLANIIYDMDIKEYGGFYFGAGFGAAFPTTSLDSWRLFSGDKKKTSVSPMGALIIGWQYPINDNFYLDIKYRLAGYNGTEQTQQWMDTNNVIYDFTNDTGFVLNNALSVGIRYEF